MTKIGILTFHRSINNGAVLQAYSLCMKLKERHPNASIEIIDFQMKKVDDSYKGSFFHNLKVKGLKRKAYFIYRLLKNPSMLSIQKKKYKCFNEAIDKNLFLSSPKLLTNNFDELIEFINSTYDILIVGSDAIWNFISRGYPNPYLPDKRINCIKLSYSASCFGMNYDEFVLTNRDTLKESLSEFEFIGVRDEATYQFVKAIDFSLIPVHTCDPTCLLDMNKLPVDNDIIVEKLKSKGFDFDKKTIGLMSLNSEQVCKYLRQMFGKEYQIVSLFEYTKGADIQLYDLNPFEWGSVFKYFNITFATYFHGTYLSLKNYTPVICIAIDNDFNKKHDSKVLDLLKRLGLSSCYFETSDFENRQIDIKSKANELMTMNFEEYLKPYLDKEAQTFNLFDEILTQSINKSN